MASKSVARGMGNFFKDCEHPQHRWSKCPHEYKIRYRSAAGKQTEESGFATQDKAITRLTDVYNAKKAAPRNQSRADRIHKYGGCSSGSTPPSGKPASGISARRPSGTSTRSSNTTSSRLSKAAG